MGDNCEIFYAVFFFGLILDDVENSRRKVAILVGKNVGTVYVQFV